MRSLDFASGREPRPKGRGGLHRALQRVILFYVTMIDRKNSSKRGTTTAKDSREIRIVEFCLGEKHYGIDVMQVREIIRAVMGIVPVSGAHPSISGVINLRGKIIPVINLARHFDICAEYSIKNSRIIVSEFEHQQVGFWVHHVTRIHRIATSHIDPPSNLMQSKGKYIVGVTKIEDKILFLIDFEKIAFDINPGAAAADDSVPIVIPRVDFDRSTKKILIVEDSALVRKLLARYIREAGYNILSVSNGLEAWKLLEDAVKSPAEPIGQQYHLLVTDIEMPHMDGFQLIKRIREHALLKMLPCIVFSPDMTGELAKRCREVGADGQIAKNEMERLVSLIDAKVLKQ